MIDLSDGRVRHTVLAALRWYQQAMATQGGLPPQEVDFIATNGAEHPPLSGREVDKLCEAINFGDVEIRTPQTQVREALQCIAQRTSAQPLSARQVGEIGTLIKDALEVINPDSATAHRRARQLALIFETAAFEIKTRGLVTPKMKPHVRRVASA